MMLLRLPSRLLPPITVEIHSLTLGLSAFASLAAVQPLLKTSIVERNAQAAAKLGLAFGGTEADDADNGLDIAFSVANVTNVDAALAGAKPALAEVGPVAYRKYTDEVEGVLSGGQLTFKTRTARVFNPVSNGGASSRACISLALVSMCVCVCVCVCACACACACVW
jgi:hypothetical protein